MVHTLLRSSPWFYALVAASLGAAGCFTSPINRTPVVTGLDADGVPPRGGTVTYTANGYDPDQDQLTWTWAVSDYPCPNASDPSKWPFGTPSPEASPTSYQVAMVAAPACVWVFATDRYGAVAAHNVPLVPTNNPPQAVIRLDSPDLADSYPAYSKFQFTGKFSTDDDNDALTYHWTLDQWPAGSTATLAACTDPSALATDPRYQCLDVLVSGQYVIGLAVSDGPATTSTSLLLKVLPDQPPCIWMTTPDFGATLLKDDPTDPNPINVNMVTDDGDPFPNPDQPLDIVQFTWFKGKNDGPLQYVANNDFPRLSLVPMDYQPGDVANVRLEVHDRNAAAIDAILAGCGDQPLCPIAPGSTCYVRVSWRIEMDL